MRASCAWRIPTFLASAGPAVDNRVPLAGFDADADASPERHNDLARPPRMPRARTRTGTATETGRSFARSPSSIELLEHTCQTGNRSAAPEKSEGALTNLQVDAVGVAGRARDGCRPGVPDISVRLPA